MVSHMRVILLSPLVYISLESASKFQVSHSHHLSAPIYMAEWHSTARQRWAKNALAVLAVFSVLTFLALRLRAVLAILATEILNDTFGCIGCIFKRGKKKS